MEAMLFKAGTISRKGSVADGTSMGLVAPEEKAQKKTVNCNLFHTKWHEHAIQILDAPGYTDFVAGAISALSACDVALLCVSAVAGIEVNTRKAWTLVQDLKVPAAIIITKMDAENADFDTVLASVQEALSPAAIPLYVPDGSAGSFTKLVPVLGASEGSEEVQAARENLMESVIEVDDALVERYLDGQEISPEEVGKAFVTAVAQGKVIPVIPVSAEKAIGLEELFSAVAANFPSAAGTTKAGTVPDKEEQAIREPSPAAPFSAQVFRIVSDKFVGKLSYFRVLSGTYSGSQPIYNARTKDKSKIGGLYRIQGAEQKEVEEVGPGDIAAISKVEDIRISDTLCDPNNPIAYKEIQFPIPMVALAVEPKSRADEQKISEVLTSLANEDPTFKTRRDSQTKETVISGMGTLHLDIMQQRMKSRFDMEVNTKEPTIPYLETITAKSEAHYRHKKQTGGRGQFGDVYIRMMPNERGAGFEFIDSVFGGSVPNQFIPAVEKGVVESMESGAFAGFPAVDLKVELYDGSYHSVDSDEQSFKIAARGAYKEAFMAAKPVLLEPIVTLEVTVPSKYFGDITSDLNRRRGRITGMESLGNYQMIRAEVPMAEIMTYSTDLRSMTGGEGDFTIQPLRSDIVPSHIAQQIVARRRKTSQEE
jgi:elongation factor G